MADESGTDQTTLSVIIAGVSAIIGAVLAKLPEILRFQNKRKQDEAQRLTSNYESLFRSMQTRIDKLEILNDKCLSEHAETKDEIRALQLRLDFMEGIKRG
jgi:hypothetical protein